MEREGEGMAPWALGLWCRVLPAFDLEAATRVQSGLDWNN